MKIFSLTCVGLCALMLATGCGSSDKNKLITRKWHITKFEMADMNDEQKKAMDSALVNASFDFRADGTTSMTMGSKTKDGKWSIEGEELVLVDESGSKEKNKISSISESGLTLVGESGGKPVTVVMEPAK